MKTIVDKQPQFFAGDTKDLHPMKLKDIADEIDMDVSTVSRSTRGKYVDTSFGIFELKSFFSGSATKQTGEIISTNLIKNTLKEKGSLLIKGSRGMALQRILDLI